MCSHDSGGVSRWLLARRGWSERPPPVVLESRAQVADLAIDHVALGHVVCPPQRVEDLLAGDHAPGVGCQQIEQALLQAGQVQLRGVHSYSSLEDVYLELADLDVRAQTERSVCRPPRLEGGQLGL